uniref:Phospholipase-like protein n=1 Tax=Tanacetum cinerariifolium TaxID=118510 RepID=A0A6L2LEF9_TANCI|nr:phospholipase-like protein [Tanacetum cinerariifolium]
MGLESCATWDRDSITWEGRDEGVGTVQVGQGVWECIVGEVEFRRENGEDDITFRDRVFPEKIGEYLKNIDLLSLIEDEYRFSSLSDPDSIRVCLLLSLKVIFMGHELGSAVDDVFLRMVEDLDVWNDFPWGEHMWWDLYGDIKNVNLNHQQGHYKALEMNPNFVLTYSLSGFLLSFTKFLEDVPGPSISHSEIGRIMGNFFTRRKNQTVTSILTNVRPNQNGLKGALIFFKMYTPRAPPVEYGANKDHVNELVDALDDLVDENGVVEVEKDFFKGLFVGLGKI